MMRKLLPLALALLLALPMGSALMQEEERAETVRQLNRLVAEYFEARGNEYEFADDVYSLTFSLENTLSTCKVEVRVYYDAIELIATPQVRAAEANRENLAILLTLINYDIFYSQFGMQLESGAFYTRNVQLVEKALPGMEEMDTLFIMAMNDLETYGDAIAQVAIAGADPYQTHESLSAE